MCNASTNASVKSVIRDKPHHPSQKDSYRTPLSHTVNSPAKTILNIHIISLFQGEGHHGELLQLLL